LWNKETTSKKVNMGILEAVIIAVLIWFLGIMNARLVVFIDFCFNTGNIFDWYYKKLLHLSPKHPKLAKVLGMCPVCMGFWVGVFTFSIFALHLGLAWVWFIPFIANSTYQTLRYFEVIK
jgi:hypothetical protein